jgi:hypothetical protein
MNGTLSDSAGALFDSLYCHNDIMQITYTATGGRTLSQELGSTRMPIAIARGRDGQPGGTLAIRVKPSR